MTVLSVAGTICEATVRFHTNSYRRRASSSRYFATEAGVRSADVGRMASCASCAFLDLDLYSFGLSGTAPVPKSRAMTSRISFTASTDRFTESVRM